jgi:hypothetical protein
MDFSRLNPRRVLAGAIASALLVISILFLPWYSLSDAVSDNAARAKGDPSAFICGTGDLKCTGFETFPIARWLLLLAAIAPVILAYILVRGHRTSYPTGEMTMVAGFSAFVLIAYNGIIDKPGSGIAEAGVSLDYGYWIALVASLGIGITGLSRSQEGAQRVRKAPGTV